MSLVSDIVRSGAAGGAGARSHDERVASEIAHFKGEINIHDLPDFFHYWSNKHLGPHVAAIFGTNDLYGIFAAELRASILATGDPNIVSIGAGDGSVEMLVAERMIADGVLDFRFTCIELSPHLIERGMEAIRDRGLEDNVTFEQSDLTYWNPARPFGTAFAHHSLHHIVALERVFDQVRASLLPRGSFVISDMIGRNGHMRWPETLAPIERLWEVIPHRYKYHHQFGKHMDRFLNWDCSGEGFEGIRAQDIMPLLVERFHFQKMCVWGGLTEIFVDRAYGHNFSTALPEDCKFIDDLWEAENALTRARGITPTQIMAILKHDPCPLLSSFGLTAQDCIRYAEPLPV